MVLDYKILNREIFNESDRLYGSDMKYHQSHENILRNKSNHNYSALKRGGSYINTTNNSIVFDNSIVAPYFISSINDKRPINGGHLSYHITGVEMRKYKSVTVNNYSEGPFGVQHQFSFTEYEGEIPNIESAIVFISEQSWCWQHFVQDLLHLIVWSRDFLLSNPEITLLLENPRDDFNCLEDIIRTELGLKNPIHYLPTHEPSNINVNALHYTTLVPSNDKYSCPPILRRYTHELLGSKEPIQNYFLYVSREKNESRKISNNTHIISVLREEALRRGLEFKILIPQENNFEDNKLLFSKSKIIFAPHGGVNYHIYWAPKGVHFIEVVKTAWMESLMTICRSININYYLLPIPSKPDDLNMTININELKKTLSLI